MCVQFQRKTAVLEETIVVRRSSLVTKARATAIGTTNVEDISYAERTIAKAENSTPPTIAAS